MNALKHSSLTNAGNISDETLFKLIAKDIELKGYSIQCGALPEKISTQLRQHQQQLTCIKYIEAGIGRGEDYLKNEFVRTDEICWINGESAAGVLWLEWTSKLKNYLNKELFLGLFSFESHFAHYAPGDYYKRHVDAFNGETNRILSIVTYLNLGWTSSDNGELVLYMDNYDKKGIKITPSFGTIVVFLSQEFPHEVLPATRDRYSVAGWYRINGSTEHKIDPPQ